MSLLVQKRCSAPRIALLVDYLVLLQSDVTGTPGSGTKRSASDAAAASPQQVPHRWPHQMQLSLTSRLDCRMHSLPSSMEVAAFHLVYLWLLSPFSRGTADFVITAVTNAEIDLDV